MLVSFYRLVASDNFGQLHHHSFVLASACIAKSKVSNRCVNKGKDTIKRGERRLEEIESLTGCAPQLRVAMMASGRREPILSAKWSSTGEAEGVSLQEKEGKRALFSRTAVHKWAMEQIAQLKVFLLKIVRCKKSRTSRTC